MINRVTLVGYVGRDPEAKNTTRSNLAIFTMATSEKWGNEEKTEWHEVVCWGKLGDIVMEHVKKGKLLYVEGTLRSNTYEDRQGQERKKWQVHASMVRFIGSPRGEQQPFGSQHNGGQPARQNGAPAPRQQNPDDDDPIPV